MKVSAFIRKTAKKNDVDTKATIYFRLRDGSKDLKSASELTINPNHWNPEKFAYKDRIALVSEETKQALKKKIDEIFELIRESYTSECDSLWLKKLIMRYHHPPKQKIIKEKENSHQSTAGLSEEFLLKHKLSVVRKKNFRVVFRCLKRYELFIQKTVRGKTNYVLDPCSINNDTLHDFWDYLKNEHLYFETYPEIFEEIKEKRPLKGRGKNTLIDYFGKLRTFLIWCYDEGKITNRPFDTFKLEECTYGSPIYITIEERNKLYSHDFSKFPEIEIQRDIFVFQSLIGCRISDLYQFTKKSVVNGAIEYIPRKGKDGRPITVRVPLNPIAKIILAKYNNANADQLLPFTYEQDYNNLIKIAFKMAGLDRIVTVIDPKTGAETKRPLNEIASSHMARRNFIGNLYKKVKDPNLIGALSGHKEGSKAFSRYREIDDDVKKEVIELLN